MGEHQHVAVANQKPAVDQGPRVVARLGRQGLQGGLIEALPQHRCGLQRATVGPCQAIEAGLDQAADRSRQQRRLGLRGTQRQLLEEQRIATRARHEALDHRLVDRTCGGLCEPLHGIRDATARASTTTTEAPPRSRRKAASTGSPSGRDVVIRTRGRDTASRAGCPHEGTQRVAGPMQVFDADRKRRVLGDGGRESGRCLGAERRPLRLLHGGVRCCAACGVGVLQHVVQSRAQAGIDGVVVDPGGSCGDQRLGEQAQRRLTAAGAEVEHPHLEAHEAAIDGAHQRLGQQPALADAGLAAQMEKRPALRCRKHGGDLREFDLSDPTNGRRPAVVASRKPSKRHSRCGAAIPFRLRPPSGAARTRLETARQVASSSTISPGFASPTMRDARFTVSPSTV